MDAQERDLYSVLGVARDAPPEDIRRAFRTRAREVHPDVSPEPDAVVRFAELTQAHDVLSRPSARLLYDRFGYVSRRTLGPRPVRERPVRPAGAPGAERPARVTRLERGDIPLVVPAEMEVVRRVPRDPAAAAPTAEPEPAERAPEPKRRSAGPAPERDTRLIRYASALGALLAAALFVTIAFVPGAL